MPQPLRSIPRRGRPPQVDPRELSLVALSLFERDGFAQVTMDDIARAAAVSRRTLFRQFPSKAALVWDGLDQVMDALGQRTAKLAGEQVSLGVLVEEICAAGLEQLDDYEVATLARRRLRLIAASPELLNHGPLLQLQETLTSLVTESSGPGDPPPGLVSRALFAVAFSSVLWWVENQHVMSVHEAVQAALSALSGATTKPRRRRKTT